MPSFLSPMLNDQQIVIDIGLAADLLKKTLAPLAYQNLDELPQFKNQLTTTEFLAQYIHSQLSQNLGAHFSGELKITLGESHVAWASYRGKV